MKESALRGASADGGSRTYVAPKPERQNQSKGSHDTSALS